MKTSHKWAKEIKAWADGEDVQWKNSNGLWEDVFKPDWLTIEGAEYRIKPVKNMYRCALLRDDTSSRRSYIYTYLYPHGTYDLAEKSRSFIYWITDEIEVDIKAEDRK